MIPPPDAPNIAVGGRLEVTLDAFERRCLAEIQHQQRSEFSDNAIIALLCDAVRMKREYVEHVAASGAPPATLDTQLEDLRARKDAAYDERNQVVSALSKLWSSHWCWHPEDDTAWEDDWRMIICVHSPVGQLTWHIHASQQKYFAHLPKGANHWDGHTTKEKYRRLASLDVAPPGDPMTAAPLPPDAPRGLSLTRLEEIHEVLKQVDMTMHREENFYRPGAGARPTVDDWKERVRWMYSVLLNILADTASGAPPATGEQGQVNALARGDTKGSLSSIFPQCRNGDR